MNAKKKKADQEYNVGISVLDQFLSANAGETEGLQYLRFADIQLNRSQPRRYFDSEALAQLSASIRKEGVLQPLIVRPLSNGRYELVAGERRYRASQQAGLEQVPVIVRELSEAQAFEIALMENLSREDLNPVEETEGLLDLLSLKLQCSREEVANLIQLGGHTDRPSAKVVAEKPEWQVVQETFAAIGRFSASTFRTHRLPLLKLPHDVLEALRAGDIEYSKAVRVARIKNDQARQGFLRRVIEENLSRADINAFLTNAKMHHKASHELTWVKKIKDVYKKAQKIKQLDADKQRQILDLLEQLERVLHS